MKTDIFQNVNFCKDALNNIERCFILGNGPTLNKINLNKLENELTIGVNRILFSGFEPDIICISDPVCLNDKNIDLLSKAKSKLILTPCVKEPLEKKIDISKKLIKITRTIYPPRFHEYKQIHDDELYENMCLNTVVGDLALPAAIFLGIKKVYLLGIDGFWNFDINQTSHFYDAETKYKDMAISNAKHQNLTINMFFSKMELLAQNIGREIYNLSPGSSIIAFKKANPFNLIENLINTNLKKNILGKYLEINDRVFKICKALKDKEDVYCLIDIENNEILRHHSRELITSKYDINDILLPEDSSFYIEDGFTNRNDCVLFSDNMKRYVVKHPYVEKYLIRNIYEDFDATKSTFKIYDKLEDINKKRDLPLKNDNKNIFKTTEHFKNINYDKLKKKIVSINNQDEYILSLYNKYNLNYENSQKIVDIYFKKINEEKIGRFSQHYYILSALSQKLKNIKNILEVGTYDGSLTKFLVEIFPNANITSIDFSYNSQIFRKFNNLKDENSLVRFLKTRDYNVKNKNIEFIEIDSLNFPYINTKKYDLIWLDNPHFDNRIQMDIINAYYMLNEDGLLLCDDIIMNELPLDYAQGFHTLENLKNMGLINVDYFLKRKFNPYNSSSRNIKFVAYVKKIQKL